jgi:hypothetical protein
MLQYLTGGQWGLVIRPILEATARTLPLIGVLFIPIIFWSEILYPWMQQSWTSYLNPEFALIRTIVYFLIWLGLTFIMTKKRQTDNSKIISPRFKRISGVGLLLYFLTMTFAAMDWIMSLDAKWSSTIYGLIIIAGQGVSALSFSIIILAFQNFRSEKKSHTEPNHFHDLGKLLLTLIMLWIYLAFSQYLIIWSGNLPDEITWILARTKGGWEVIGLFVLIAHFAIPFLLLLSRNLKRNPQRLAFVAALLLFMRWIDTFWYIQPAFYPSRFSLHWLDFTLPLALCSFSFAFFLKQLRNNEHRME